MNADRTKNKYEHYDGLESPPLNNSDERDHIDRDLMKGWDHDIEDEDISPWSAKEPDFLMKTKVKANTRHKRGHSLKSNREREKSHNSTNPQEFNISLNRVFSSRGRNESEEPKMFPEYTTVSNYGKYSDPLNDVFEKGVMSTRRDSREIQQPQSLRKSHTYRDIKSETTMMNKSRVKRPSTSQPKTHENYIHSVINFPPKVYSSNKETFEEKKARIVNLVSDGPVKGERIGVQNFPTPPKSRRPASDRPTASEIYMRQRAFQDESMAHPQFVLADPMESFSLTQNSKLVPRLYKSNQKKFFYDSRHELSYSNISVDRFGRTRKVVMNPKLVLEPYDLSPSKNYLTSVERKDRANISRGTAIREKSITIDDTHDERSLLDGSNKKPKQEESTHAFGFVTKLLSTLKTKPESSTNFHSHRALTSTKGERSPIGTFNKNVVLSLNRHSSANKRPTTSTNPVDRSSKSPVISSYRARKIKETGIGLQAAMLQGLNAKIIRFE